MTNNDNGNWGGKREGSGRPVGTTKEIVRKTRSLRAFDDEWELIKEFTKIVKKDKQLAMKILSMQNN